QLQRLVRARERGEVGERERAGNELHGRDYRKVSRSSRRRTTATTKAPIQNRDFGLGSGAGGCALSCSSSEAKHSSASLRATLSTSRLPTCASLPPIWEWTL